MSELYFKKEILSNFVNDDAGQKIEWEACANNIGVLKLDSEKDAALVKSLEGYVSRRVGGVVKISAEIYEAQKKSVPVLRKSGGPFGRDSQIRAFKEPELFPQKPSSLPAKGAPSAGAVDEALNPGQTPPRGFGSFRARTTTKIIPPSGPVPPA